MSALQDMEGKPASHGNGPNGEGEGIGNGDECQGCAGMLRGEWLLVTGTLGVRQGD